VFAKFRWIGLIQFSIDIDIDLLLQQKAHAVLLYTAVYPFITMGPAVAAEKMETYKQCLRNSRFSVFSSVDDLLIIT